MNDNTNQTLLQLQYRYVYVYMATVNCDNASASKQYPLLAFKMDGTWTNGATQSNIVDVQDRTRDKPNIIIRINARRLGSILELVFVSFL